MKKAYLVVIILVGCLMFTACDSKDASAKASSTVTAVKSDIIKSTVTHEAEEQRIAVENTVADSEEEVSTPVASSEGYVSGDSFWNGDSYFDIVGFFEANGIEVKGYILDEVEGCPRVEKNAPTIYKGQFSESGWRIHVAEYTVIGVSNTEGKSYTITACENLEDRVAVNSTGMLMTRNAIESIVDIVYLVKTHSNEEDPLQYNNGSYSYI